MQSHEEMKAQFCSLLFGFSTVWSKHIKIVEYFCTQVDKQLKVSNNNSSFTLIFLNNIFKMVF